MTNASTVKPQRARHSRVGPGAPAGATATFSNGSFTSPPPNNPVTSSFSLTTTAGTTPGTYTFPVTATDGAGCQDTNTTSSSNVTLIVVKNVGYVTVEAQPAPLTYGTAGSPTYTVTVTRNAATGNDSSAPPSRADGAAEGRNRLLQSGNRELHQTQTSATSTLTITTTGSTPACTRDSPFRRRTRASVSQATPPSHWRRLSPCRESAVVGECGCESEGLRGCGSGVVVELDRVQERREPGHGGCDGVGVVYARCGSDGGR